MSVPEIMTLMQQSDNLNSEDVTPTLSSKFFLHLIDFSCILGRMENGRMMLCAFDC